MGTSRTRYQGTDLGLSPAGSYDAYFESGYHVGNYPATGVSVWPELNECRDVTDAKPYPDHPLTIIKKRLRPSLANGRSKEPGAGGWYYDFHNYMFGMRNIQLLEEPVSPQPVSYYLTKLLANANPSRPDVNVPVFLFELKDFPRMLKELGDVLARRIKPSMVAGGYLSYSFGWAPLFGDLLKLLQLQKAIDNRIKLLRQYERGKRQKRKLGFNTYSLGQLSENHDLGNVRLTYNRQFSEKVWATYRITLATSLPRTADALQALAARQVLGLNFSMATLWEALPWSWLIDYFANIGEFLEASRDNIPFRIERVNIMVNSRIEYQLSSLSVTPGRENLPICKVSPGYYLAERKTRMLPSYLSPTPFFGGRFFTPHMRGILSSLATASALRGFKL
jgi:hypothetical protein